MAKEATKIQEVPAPKQRTIQALLEDPIAIKVSRILLHQAFAIPAAGTELTLHEGRMPGIKMAYHPMYGVIVENKGKRVIIPAANVIAAYE